MTVKGWHAIMTVVQDRTFTKTRELREAAGLSQQALSSRAGIAIRTLVRVEQGEDTTLGTLRQIANALDVSVSTLIGDAA